MRARVTLPLLVLLAAGAARSEEPGYEKLNAIFGAPIWADDNLWDDADDAVAERLKWPKESKTTTLSSYRLYAGADVKMLGARPFSLALYGEEGKPARFSLVFLNKGDVAGAFITSDLDSFVQDKKAREAMQEKIKKALKDFPKQLKAEAETVEAALTAGLGQPQRDKFGQSKATREKVLRWDWKGHAILLAAPEDEYVGVRIMPIAEADSGGKPQRVKDADLRPILKQRVEQRPNGDVVVGQIPMVDQGPKGFCVPATWERFLRYMGIPADMYVLAMAGGTQFAGGTIVGVMTANAEDIVQRNGRRLAAVSGGPNIRKLAAHIDDGLPLMWSVLVDLKFERELIYRAEDRKKVTDWAEWSEKLKAARKAAKSLKPSRDNGHMRMIIGYNPKTEEIAISDSWGPEFQERWLAVEEAEAITAGPIQLISW
ncbi:MAG TPA: hypothetical protein PLU30_14525 [Verrucomicrobiae bacterium]|mgnify:CR=1 FL=1|nr:hypothetical protein [Verrucomicrobiae bacterium]